MDNSKNVLQSLIDKANKRIKEIKSGKNRLLLQMKTQNIMQSLQLI